MPFVTNSLQAYRHFFFSEGYACDVFDRSHLPPRGSVFTVTSDTRLSRFRGDYEMGMDGWIDLLTTYMS
jgi:hypothetical protein